MKNIFYTYDLCKVRSCVFLIFAFVFFMIFIAPDSALCQAGSNDGAVINETLHPAEKEIEAEAETAKPDGMRLPFFILLVIGVGAVFGAATFLGSIGAIFIPSLQSKPDLTKVVVKTGKAGSKKKKILIAYQTKNGGSVKVGLKMWEILSGKGYHVDMKHIPDIINDDISEYDAFIVGGAIYWSMFMLTTREFIKKNADLFSKKPTALFMLCGKMVNEFATRLQGDEAKWSRLSKAYLVPMLNEIPKFKPVDIGTFAGDIFYRMMNLPEFIMMGVLMFKNGSKQGAYIDLGRVSKWTEKIIKEFKI